MEHNLPNSSRSIGKREVKNGNKELGKKWKEKWGSLATTVEWSTVNQDHLFQENYCHDIQFIQHKRLITSAIWAILCIYYTFLEEYIGQYWSDLSCISYKF